jgi:hypothetical protein
MYHEDNLVADRLTQFTELINRDLGRCCLISTRPRQSFGNANNIILAIGMLLYQTIDLLASLSTAKG